MDENNKNEYSAVDGMPNLHSAPFSSNSSSISPKPISAGGGELAGLSTTENLVLDGESVPENPAQSEEFSRLRKKAFFGLGFSALFVVSIFMFVYFLKPQNFIAGLFRSKETVQPAPNTKTATILPVTQTPSVSAEPTKDIPEVTSPDSNRAPATSPVTSPTSTDTTPPAAQTEAPTTAPLTYGKVEKQLGTFVLPAGVKTLEGILYWPDKPVYTLKLVLVDPTGTPATDVTYPGSSFITTSPAMSFISYPKPGKWTAYVYGDNVPNQSSEYYFIASIPK